MVALKKAKLTKSFNWESIADELSAIFHLSKEEKEKVLKSPAARLTAEIAYLAGCHDPDRVAMAHVGTIIIASKNPRFSHKKNESLYNRMAVLDHYPGGNPEIVKAGMILLELISLYDHVRDIESDRKIGKYNPLLDDIEYISERDRLLDVVNNFDPAIQEMYRAYTEFLPFSWWIS